MEDCLFCSIISKKEKAYIIYEDEYVCCFLDRYPICKGHILVVPKRHYIEFSDVDLKSLHKVIEVAQRIAVSLEELLGTDGITVMQNNGIFKSVDHYHMHLVPRYRQDGFSWIEPENIVTNEEFAVITKDLKETIKRVE